jgi:hypothetical protein
MQNTFDFHHDCCLKQKNLDPCCKLSYIMLSIPWPSCAYWGKAGMCARNGGGSIIKTWITMCLSCMKLKKTMKMGIMVLKSSLENDWTTKIKKHRVNLEASRRSRHDMIYITLEHLPLMHKLSIRYLTSCFQSWVPSYCLYPHYCLGCPEATNMPRSKSSFEKVSFDGHCSISGDLTESAPVRLKQ